MESTSPSIGRLRDCIQVEAREGVETPIATPVEPKSVYTMPAAFHPLRSIPEAPLLPWHTRRDGIKISDRFNVLNPKIDGSARIDSIRTTNVPRPAAIKSDDDIAKQNSEAHEEQAKPPAGNPSLNVQESPNHKPKKNVQFSDFSYAAYDDCHSDDDNAYPATVYVAVKTKQDEYGYYRHNGITDVIHDTAEAERAAKKEEEENRLQFSDLFSFEVDVPSASLPKSGDTTATPDNSGTCSAETEQQLRDLHDRAKAIDLLFYKALNEADDDIPSARYQPSRATLLEQAYRKLILETMSEFYASAQERLGEREHMSGKFDQSVASRTTKISVLFYRDMNLSIENVVTSRTDSDISDLILRLTEFALVSDNIENQQFVKLGIKTLAAVVGGREKLLKAPVAAQLTASQQKNTTSS